MSIKEKNNKGFTRAELVIVMAIIAVLVAITFSILDSRLERAREVADLANIRAVYAECCAAVLAGDIIDRDLFVCEKKASGGYVASATVPLTQTKPYWQMGDVVVGGFTLGEYKLDKTSYIEVTLDSDKGKPTFYQHGFNLLK